MIKVKTIDLCTFYNHYIRVMQVSILEREALYQKIKNNYEKKFLYSILGFKYENSCFRCEWIFWQESKITSCETELKKVNYLLSIGINLCEIPQEFNNLFFEYMSIK